ncbi:MAG: hypothetical protein K8S23_11785 [Candidatus Cloacimonetes bacterium]|nr:hypothetical protein [Candidatus Cloacimonadota bacterium]
MIFWIDFPNTQNESNKNNNNRKLGIIQLKSKMYCKKNENKKNSNSSTNNYVLQN